MSEIQSITDSLARRIQRPVNIDDAEMRLLTHSAQAGAVIDDGRLATILRRRVPDEVVSWLRSLGIASASGAVRIPANPALGTLARVCVPIRCRDTLLGYLWVIDSDSSLGEGDLSIVNSAAEAAGNALYRELLLTQLEIGRERELLRDLLSDQPDIRQYAAEELAKGDTFVKGAIFYVLIARPILTGDREWDDDVRLAMSGTLERVGRGRLPRRSLHLVRPDHAVSLMTVADARHVPSEMMAQGRWLHTMLAERLAEAGATRLLVGIGGVQSALTDAVRSYHQARQATRVAEIVASFGPVVAWSQLGIYQTLSHFPVERLTADALHPGLVKLLQHPDGEWLVETLERYLDHAGDTKAVAADLVVHRASVYYRLQKIEEIAGVDLRQGEDRLALHLGLKLARLAGIYPPARRG